MQYCSKCHCDAEKQGVYHLLWHPVMEVNQHFADCGKRDLEWSVLFCPRPERRGDTGEKIWAWNEVSKLEVLQ